MRNKSCTEVVNRQYIVEIEMFAHQGPVESFPSHDDQLVPVWILCGANVLTLVL